MDSLPDWLPKLPPHGEREFRKEPVMMPHNVLCRYISKLSIYVHVLLRGHLQKSFHRGLTVWGIILP
jgi:hypothetical protein